MYKPREDNPHMEQVIITYTNRGEGTKNDRIRRVLVIYILDGEFIAENDPGPK